MCSQIGREEKETVDPAEPARAGTTTAKAPLSRSEAIELLGYYLEILPPRWQNLQSFVGVFVTVDLTVLGATFLALARFSTWPKNVFILLAPIAAIVVAHFGKETLRRQDRHIRELIVLIAHLEEYIGLHHSYRSGEGLFWPQDKALLPQRWIDARIRHACSEDFIADPAPGGTVKASMRMFSWLQFLALSVGIAVIILPIV
jgi:hypothetical protein